MTASRPAEFDTRHTRRLRLVLVLGVTTGLWLAEMCTARLGDLHDELVDGRRVWLLHVAGKGRRERDVVIHDDVKALIDRHQTDMAPAGIRACAHPAAASADGLAGLHTGFATPLRTTPSTTK